MKKYLAIFDLDGTLFDTKEVNYFSYKEALKPYGIELERDYFFDHCYGHHYLEFLPFIMGNSENVEEVHKLKKEVYPSHLHKATINQHLFRMINVLRDEYYTAVVTTASKKNTTDLLCYFGFQDYFDYVVTQENVEKKKPNPEGFLTVMKHFKVDAKHTVIFEDSDTGIQAGRATGATVFIVDRI